ncbi:MAG: hypothetical protein OEV03_09245, partial [Gammaproteobacteria bacterium]|nr:hypothetical protein [Gammaproteobacteria bacterium]
MIYLVRIVSIFATLALASTVLAASAQADDTATDTRPSVAPDIREDESKLKLQKGNFVVVPVPISNPTLDTGLVAGQRISTHRPRSRRKLSPLR